MKTPQETFAAILEDVIEPHMGELGSLSGKLDDSPTPGHAAIGEELRRIINNFLADLDEKAKQLESSGAELRVLAESLEADLREAPDMTDEAIREVYGP